MFERDESLEKLAVFLGEIVAIRVLLDFALSVKTLSTPALEWKDLVAEQELLVVLIWVLSSTAILRVARRLLLLLLHHHLRVRGLLLESTRPLHTPIGPRLLAHHLRLLHLHVRVATSVVLA